MVVRERCGKERRIKSKKMMQGLYCSGSCYCYFVSTMYVRTQVFPPSWRGCSGVSIGQVKAAPNEDGICSQQGLLQTHYHC